jgi:hypothetical protein
VVESFQREQAESLLREVGISDRECTLDDVKTISQHYKGEYQIMVRDAFNFLYKDAVTKEKKIMLFYDSERKHFHTIISPTGFLGVKYFCSECNVRYNDSTKHKCTRGCGACGSRRGSCGGFKMRCNDCNRYCYSRICYNNHKKNKLCETLFRCKECGILVDKKKRSRDARGAESSGHLNTHTCGEIFCSVCRGHYLKPHLCYMHPVRDRGKSTTTSGDDDSDGYELGSDSGVTSYDLIEESEMLSGGGKKMKTVFLFYDFETAQETELEDGSFEHKVNYAVVKIRCEDCADKEEDEISDVCDSVVCSTCCSRKIIFSGEETLEKFCGFTFSLSATEGMSVVAIAHNSSGFDAQFILQYCFERGEKPKKFIALGTKIMSMTVAGVKFIDSFRFLPMPLHRLPSSFGLKSLAKGDFPHLFNRKENWGYIGEIPDFKYYGADSRREKEKEELHTWWKEQRESGYLFNFQTEIRKYCETDVEILEKACIRFRRLFMAESGIDPFTRAVTIASACSLLFRKMFLVPNTIGIANPRGYSFRDTQSHLAIVWLLWEEKQRRVRIQHAANGREAVLLRRLKVDGYIPGLKMVFEFQGCAFHGCPQCYHSPSARKRLVPNSNSRTKGLSRIPKRKINALPG